MAYDNNMTGIISKNERKTTDKHPDIKGQCEIDGVQYWVDGWMKTRNSDNGKFYSLSFKAKDAAKAPAPAPSRTSAPSTGSGFDDMSDDIPFISCEFGHDLLTAKQKRMRGYDF